MLSVLNSYVLLDQGVIQGPHSPSSETISKGMPTPPSRGSMDKAVSKGGCVVRYFGSTEPVRPNKAILTGGFVLAAAAAVGVGVAAGKLGAAIGSAFGPIGMSVGGVLGFGLGTLGSLVAALVFFAPSQPSGC